jgi:signal transduction histidine kinase
VYGLAESWKAVRFSFADSVTGLVIQERRAIRVEDVQEKNLSLTQQLAHFGKAQPHSFLAVPLWREEQPMGALIVGSTASRSFSLEDERILHALADHAALAIHKAQLYEQLQSVLHREQEAGKQQAAFFASASHELRTPLNIILGYIDLVREGVIGQVDAEAAETLDRVRGAAQHMISLVNDLLDLARIERAEFQLHPAVVDLEELLAEVCSMWEKPITEKGLSFQRVGASSFPPLVTDKARLRQILDNLLGNALKFTQTGHIAIGARVLEHNIEIWVEDTGIGIDPLYHEKIFDEFQQVEHASTSQLEGFGLGLAVCKKIAQLLQGDIRLESVVGRGSTFTVSLVRQHS